MAANETDPIESNNVAAEDTTVLDVAVQSAVWVREGPHGATTTADVLVALSAVSQFDVSVTYQTSDVEATGGIDYVAASGTLTPLVRLRE